MVSTFRSFGALLVLTLLTSSIGLAYLASVRATEASVTSSSTASSPTVEPNSEGLHQSQLLAQSNLASFYATTRGGAIADVGDIDPEASPYADTLRLLMEDWSVVRLYSDSSFQPDSEITQAEAVDWLGATLNQVYDRAEAALPRCDFRRPQLAVAIPTNVEQDYFYYDAYRSLASALGQPVTFAADGTGGPFRSNQFLKRADIAVALHRYLIQPTNNFFPGKELESQPVSNRQFEDVKPADDYAADIDVLVNSYGLFPELEARFEAGAPVTRGEFAQTLAALVTTVEQQISAYSPTDCINDEPLQGTPTFAFRNGLEYSYCVEDVVQLYLDPQTLARKGRRSDCSQDIFASYAEDGLTKSQAIEMLTAANTYATQTLDSRLQPPPGQQTRIEALLGFTYGLAAPQRDNATEFAFTNAFEYSICLEDILQLYFDPVGLQSRGRGSDCRSDLFAAAGTEGLSKVEALELIQTADLYATQELDTRLFPPRGQRIRIANEFGFVYAIDREIAADSAGPSGNNPFGFSTLLGYSNCLEDILQLYSNPSGLAARGRQGACLPEVFEQIGDRGLTRTQALELIEAADRYATSELSARLYPPGGQRRRVQELFGYTYAIDRL